MWADVKDNNKPDPGEEIPAVSGTDWSMPAILDTTNAAQNCTTSRPCTWDKNVPFSWQANMAQNAAQVMYYLNKYHDHLAGAPVRLHGGGGQLRGGGRRPGPGQRDGRGELGQRPPGQEPLQQRQHEHAAGRQLPDDADVPLPRAARAAVADA